MERITAYPFEEVNSTLARRINLSDAGRQLLPDSRSSPSTSATAAPAAGRAAKRIAVRLRWRGSSGEWDAPVRLTSWIERRKGGS